MSNTTTGAQRHNARQSGVISSYILDVSTRPAFERGTRVTVPPTEFTLGGAGTVLGPVDDAWSNPWGVAVALDDGTTVKAFSRNIQRI